MINSSDVKGVRLRERSQIGWMDSVKRAIDARSV